MYPGAEGMVVARLRGLKAVEAIHGGYGEKPNQGRIGSRGNAYLKAEYPDLDYVVRASIVEP